MKNLYEEFFNFLETFGAILLGCWSLAADLVTMLALWNIAEHHAYMGHRPTRGTNHQIEDLRCGYKI